MFCAHCHGKNGDGKGSISHPVYGAIPGYSDKVMIRRTGKSMSELKARKYLSCHISRTKRHGPSQFTSERQGKVVNHNVCARIAATRKLKNTI